MELQMKYQYTYFIYPYVIEKEKLNKYILTLLNNKQCKIGNWKKEENLDMYNFFLPPIRKYIFNDFKIKNNQSNINDILQEECNIFQFKLDEDIQGKVGNEDGIFFKIQKIHILCFKCGICFLILKTNVENTKNFSDILNFNYKFRDINSDFSLLKEYENIKIQTNTFENMKEITEFINEVTDNSAKNNEIDTNRFYTYSYVCLEQECWEAENLDKEFTKFSKILPSNSNENIKAKDIFENVKYTKIGITDYGIALLCSSIESKNYTTLPITYENEYFYLYIMALYEKLYLKKIFIDLKNNTKNAKTEYIDLKTHIIENNVTNDYNGNILYNNYRKALKLDELLEEIKMLFDLEYKKLDIDKAKKTNKILFAILLASLLLNIINFIILLKFK